MSWTNVCVEGFCFGEEKDGKYPCGRHVPSPFCLGNGRTGACPHFSWSDTTERMVAHFVPLRLIIWDKLKVWITETAYWKLRWWFWDCLWFNRRKVNEFFENIKVIGESGDPVELKWLAEEKVFEAKQDKRFEKWFPKAKKEW